MKTQLIVISTIAIIVSISAAVGQNLFNNNQNSQSSQTSEISVVQSDVNNDDMNSNFSFTSQQSSSSSSYQTSSIGLSAANLKDPHILSIKTSGNKLAGEIRINGKVVKQIRNKKVDIDLSPYLSVGNHTVEISARYSPSNSGVSVDFKAPGTSNTQEVSGDGSLNYRMDVNVN